MWRTGCYRARRPAMHEWLGPPGNVLPSPHLSEAYVADFCTSRKQARLLATSDNDVLIRAFVGRAPRTGHIGGAKLGPGMRSLHAPSDMAGAGEAGCPAQEGQAYAGGAGALWGASATVRSKLGDVHLDLPSGRGDPGLW